MAEPTLLSPMGNYTHTHKHTHSQIKLGELSIK